MQPHDPLNPFLFLNVRRYDVAASPGIEEWFAEQAISLLFTTTKSRLFTVGLKPNAQLELGDYEFEGCTSLHAPNSQSLYMVTRFQLWRLENAIHPSVTADYDHDACYIPKSAYTTGALHINDLAVSALGQPLFVNSLYNCLATTGEHYNFAVRWRPPFLRHMPFEVGDCCHLSGVAMREGQAAFVTSASLSDEPNGWKELRQKGGVVFDLANEQVAVRGLSLPHAPRWYKNELWLLNSGTGHLGRVDLKRGEFEPVTFCPGILRGLAFVDRFAIVAISKPDESGIFAGLEINERLERMAQPAQCALLIIDTLSGEIVHSIQFTGKNLTGIFDLAVLPQVRRPLVVTFAEDAIEDTITIGNPAALGISPLPGSL